jgi:hypothetical protein
MSKTFRYTKFAKYHYCEHSQEWEEGGVEFDYEVEDEQLLPYIVDFMFDDYFGDDKVVIENEEFSDLVKSKLKALIEKKNLVGFFAESYETKLKEIFEKEALEFYED